MLSFSSVGVSFLKIMQWDIFSLETLEFGMRHSQPSSSTMKAICWRKKRKLTTSLFFFFFLSLLPSFFLYSGPWEIQLNFAPLLTFSSSNLGMWREVETLVWMLPITMSFWTTIQMSEWYLFEWYIISKRKYLPKEVCHPSFPIRMRSDVYLKAQ